MPPRPPDAPRPLWILFAPLAAVVLLTVGILWAGQAMLLRPTFYPAPTQTLPTRPTAPPTPPSPHPAPPIPPTATPSPPPSPTATARPTETPTPVPLGGLVQLTPENTDRYLLEPRVADHPHGLVVLGERAYLLDGGEIVAVPLTGGTQVVRLEPPAGRVDGLPLGEPVALALSPQGDALLVLDKRGDLYRYDPGSDRWGVERPMDRRRTAPNPVPVAIASYNGLIYTLDVGYSQVWRYPYDDVAEGYLPGGDSPWDRVGTSLDLTRGIGLTVDGDVYVLLREGTSGAADLARFTGRPAERDAGLTVDLERPTFLYGDPEGAGPLYLLDREGERLRLLERGTGTVLQEYAAPPGVEMRAIYERERLYIAAPGALYLYPGSGQVALLTGGRDEDGILPSEEDLARLAGRLALPLQGMRHLPERDSLLPGAPRVYRYGIHRGWDIYDGMTGATVSYGTPVLAVADGVVIRADLDYREPSPAAWREMAARCTDLHETPPDILDRFRGRQVWIDHGDGLVSRYVHLSGIAEGIVTGTALLQGQVLGYVGNSGTSEGAAGNQNGAHLHLELLLHGHYLGEGLSLVEVRRLLQRLFFP